MENSTWRRLLILASAVLLLGTTLGKTAAQTTTDDMKDAGLIVGNVMLDTSDSVLRYDGLGNFVDTLVPFGEPLSGVQHPCCLTFGPDENLYVSDPFTGRVLRFNGVTGAYIDTFIPSGRGGLIGPLILLFRDGYLYVGDTMAGAIRRYDASTGAFVDNFLPDNSQGMGAIPGDEQFFAFGPDNNLYVVAGNSKEIFRYNGQTGAFLDVFAPTDSEMNTLSGLAFDKDGRLYLGDYGSGEVRRYDIATGTYEVFIPAGGPLSGPVGIGFGPDGNFYATSVGSSAIQRFDPTGNYLGPLVPTGQGGMTGPRTMAWKVKTMVCHAPPGNNAKSKTLSIGYLSARDHLRHGDTLGACK